MTTEAFTWRHVLYRLFSELDQLLYVGITNSIEARFSTHQSCQPWWPDVHHSTVEFFPDREALAKAELQAIRTEGPLHNKAGLPTGRWKPLPKLEDRMHTTRAAHVEVHPDGLIVDGQKIAGLDIQQARTEMDDDQSVLLTFSVRLLAETVMMNRERLIPIPEGTIDIEPASTPVDF